MEDTRGNVRVSWHLNLVYSVSWCIYIYIYIFLQYAYKRIGKRIALAF